MTDIVKGRYKKILKKLGLSLYQLQDLKDKLIPENICKGPFVENNKNCPNTTALAAKEGITRFKESDEVRKLLTEKYKVGKLELWMFYFLFDIPAKMSDVLFIKSVNDLKDAVVDLIQEKEKTTSQEIQ